MNTQDTSIYDDMKSAGIAIDHHESDLYIPATQEARAILDKHGNTSYTAFISQVDGTRWYDVPFMYAPWWDARGGCLEYA